MCEFCIQHGEGKKWFQASKNYSEKLAQAVEREEFIRDFFKNYERNYRKNVLKADLATRMPFIREYAKKKISNYFTKKHAGQVVCLEDAISICGLAGRVSVIECPCRKYLFNAEERECILFGTTAEIVEGIPSLNLKDLGVEDAVELLKSVENKGEIHTVWTFMTPYIGAICNCGRTQCLMFHLKNRYDVSEIIRKGHEKAVVDHELCDGCGKCQRVCQFNAITLFDGEARINTSDCYGCGTCRNHCPESAIQLVPRND